MSKGGFSWRRLSGISRTKSRISRAIGVPLTKSGRQRKFGAAIGTLAGSGKQAKAGAATGCLVLVIMINLFIAGTGLLVGCGLVGVKNNMPASELTDARQWRKAGFTSTDAKLWLDSGFTVEEAKKWREIGSGRVYPSMQSQIADAKEWKKAGFAAEEATWWAVANIGVEKAIAFKKMPNTEAERKQLNEEIQSWIRAGIPFLEFPEWEKQGFSPEEAGKWNSFGYSPADVKREEAEQNRVNKAGYGPNADILTRRELRSSSPYSIKGKYCYLDCAEGIQLLDRFNGIYLIGSHNDHPCFVLIKFKGQDAPPPGEKIKVKAKGVGVFQYTNALGALQIIPALDAIAMKDWHTTSPYWPNEED